MSRMYLDYLRLCKQYGYGVLSEQDPRWEDEYKKMYINS